MKIGKRIRDLRKKKGWTQEQLAERAGVNEKHLQDIEAGRVDVRIRTLEKIGKVLGDALIRGYK